MAITTVDSTAKVTSSPKLVELSVVSPDNTEVSF